MILILYYIYAILFYGKTIGALPWPPHRLRLGARAPRRDAGAVRVPRLSERDKWGQH